MSKITYERMRVIIDFNSPYYEEMIMYINQQEKKAQLLELSLRLNEVWKQRYEYTNSANTIKDLENQISDLMKEIKVGQI